MSATVIGGIDLPNAIDEAPSQPLGIRRKFYADTPVFVLDEDHPFYETSFKVMQGEEGASLLPCRTIEENGELCLLYLAGGCAPLSEQINRMAPHDALRFSVSFAQALQCVSQNGFLSTGVIASGSSEIYVNEADYSARLIFLPIREPVSGRYSSGGAMMPARTSLAQCLSARFGTSSTSIAEACRALGDAALSPEQLNRHLHGLLAGAGFTYVDLDGSCAASAFQGVSRRRSKVASTGIVLQPKDDAACSKIVVDKSDFRIGRNAKANDAVISNPAVSRKHCKITESESGYAITDLDSSFGTFVNGCCLKRDTPFVLKVGDEVSIAGVVFRVESVVGQQ